MIIFILGLPEPPLSSCNKGTVIACTDKPTESNNAWNILRTWYWSILGYQNTFNQGGWRTSSEVVLGNFNKSELDHLKNFVHVNITTTICICLSLQSYRGAYPHLQLLLAEGPSPIYQRDTQDKQPCTVFGVKPLRQLG